MFGSLFKGHLSTQVAMEDGCEKAGCQSNKQGPHQYRNPNLCKQNN